MPDSKLKTPVVASLISAGLAGVIAYNWQEYSFREGQRSSDFLREQIIDWRSHSITQQEKLVDALQATAASGEKVALHIQRSVDIQRELVREIDDMSDETRMLNKWVNELYEQGEELLDEFDEEEDRLMEEEVE